MREAFDRSDVFRAIADPTRRAILDNLRTGSVAVNGLAERFSQSRPAISAHLRVLREADIVSEVRRGRQRIYQLHPEKLREIDLWIDSYRSFWTASLTELKAHLENEHDQ
jgi:DNA-binding transcriptional ArsR family regulator